MRDASMSFQNTIKKNFLRLQKQNCESDIYRINNNRLTKNGPIF